MFYASGSIFPAARFPQLTVRILKSSADLPIQPLSRRDVASLDGREGMTKVDPEVPFVARSEDCVLQCIKL